MPSRKRGYSREFPTGQLPRRRFQIDWVPPGLLLAAKRKAKREGVSLRTKVLGLLKTWVEEP